MGKTNKPRNYIFLATLKFKKRAGKMKDKKKLSKRGEHKHKENYDEAQ